MHTKGGVCYYVSFIDDYTRYTWIYLMHKKSEFYSIRLFFCNYRHPLWEIN